MISLIDILLVTATTLIIHFVQTILRFKKINRAKQAVLPVISFVYSIIAIIIISVLNKKIYNLLQRLFEDIEFDLLAKIHVICLLNIVLAVGFIAIKLLLLPVIAGVFKNNALVNLTAGVFYEYVEDYDRWFLKYKFIKVRRILKAFVFVGIPFYIILLHVINMQKTTYDMFLFIFPYASLIVINEIYSFFNGLSKDEFDHEIYGEDPESNHITNYYKIREVLANLFPQQSIASHTGCEYNNNIGNVNMITDMINSGDDIQKIVGEYFDHNVKKSTIDVDYMQATQSLLEGKSVVFNNPFYRDLGSYITLPLITALLRGKKVLVVLGRTSTCEDVKSWINELIYSYTKIHNMWRLKELSNIDTDFEVGVITFSQLYDMRVIDNNREFFQNTEFTLILEPSLIVNTAQVGLSLIADEVKTKQKRPVYCICDRKVEGLVDTMSHVLFTELVDVVPAPLPRCVYTSMSWSCNDDYFRQRLFDRQTKFLGNGMEIASTAIKHQIPHVSWYSETKSPIRDIKWIAGQNYPTLCRYMNVPIQQQLLYDKIEFVSNIWSAPVKPEQFLIVEDEFCNMYGALMTFLSRGKKQIFVNVLSENYLLREYMASNREIFTSNTNAIPSIVPDYAKTPRNVLLKLILMMTFRPVTEKEIIEQLSLVGYKTNDAFSALTNLLKKYTKAENSIFTNHVIRSEDDLLTTASISSFSIAPHDFEEYFSSSLKNAYFILEDETVENGYIDAKMFGHVTQSVLPGQFLTYDGKYYIVQRISESKEIILRRASDLYNTRKYYKQIREYNFDALDSSNILSARSVMGFDISFSSADFNVKTTGYLEMDDSKDIKNAKIVDLSNDPSVNLFYREYKHKTIMKLKIADMDDETRSTLCLMFSEIFKSIFPDAYQYLAVLTKCSAKDNEPSNFDYINYKANGELEDGVIYIIEDSDIDLGLIEAVDKNIMRLLEVVTEYLDWHFEKLAEVDPEPVERTEPDIVKQPEKKKGVFSKISDFFKSLWGKIKRDKKPKPQQDDDNSDDDNNVDNLNGVKEYTVKDGSSQDNMLVSPDATVDTATEEPTETTAIVPVESTDGEEETAIVPVESTDSVEVDIEVSEAVAIRENLYSQNCYLKYGFDFIDERLKTKELLTYLTEKGFSKNQISKARKESKIDPDEIALETVNHCDFCGVPLSGISYDKLTDGRIRCNDCSSSAINTTEEFVDLFFKNLAMMKDFFNINFKVPINVKVVDAQTVNAGVGYVFKPSKEFAARVLGYAQLKHGKYSLVLENGSPRLAIIDTMIHELTHIWQYIYWDDAQIIALYGQDQREIVYEGMAMWAAIQYLYLIGETNYANKQEILTEARNDIYGIGFRYFKEKYPLSKDDSLIKHSPFSTFPVL